ncbi:O-antigen ligase family protein [Natronomonas gomsonensis]|uniref:O-antigen ligase family protein n=1 Tax=Natronomonas gomsonensis TaxID=1046043 RepID=UPI0020CA825F|nr:O-antigen ligase family protein [Natronomonas gomsonensis]MCY4732429.1 O-antigen ligase family protein [Natronomonas gomsonensis]
MSHFHNFSNRIDIWTNITFYFSLIFLFVLPWRNALVIVDVGTSITIGWLFGLMLGISWLISIYLKKSIRKPDTFHILFFLFTLWVIVSIIWASKISLVVEDIVRYLYIFGVIIAFWDVYRSERRLNFGFQSYIIGVFILMTASIVDYFVISSYSRATPFGLNPNELGSHVVLGVPIAYYLIRSNLTTEYQKFINYIFIFFAILTAFISGSRTAIVVLTVVMAAILGISTSQLNNQRDKYVSSIIVGITTIFSWLLLPPKIQSRIMTVPQLIQDGDLGNRQEIWLSGYHLFIENPIFGIGSGHFPLEVGITAHSVYLSILVELGVIGLFMFIAILISAFKSVITSKDTYQWSLIFLCCFLVILPNDMGFVAVLLVLNFIIIGRNINSV